MFLLYLYEDNVIEMQKYNANLTFRININICMSFESV